MIEFTSTIKDIQIRTQKEWDKVSSPYIKIIGIFENKELGVFENINDLINHPKTIFGFLCITGNLYDGSEFLFINKIIENKISYKLTLNGWIFFYKAHWSYETQRIKLNGHSIVDLVYIELIVQDKYGESKVIKISKPDSTENQTGYVYIHIYNTILKYSKYDSWYDYASKNKIVDSSVSTRIENNSNIDSTNLNVLNQMIGLQSVKEDVCELISLLKIRKIRQQKDLPISPSTLHLVFTGNPGTGKTTVARLLGDIYKEIGILKKGHFVEADRAALVGEYIGHTAVKTTNLFKEALGGILFIDEAYTLSKGNENDFGKEAIDCILKLMEDNRDEIVVIIAGYTERINEFLSSNPGLKSRFPKYIHFEDYNTEELLQICKDYFNKYKYSITTDAEIKLVEMLNLYDNDSDFGNARGCRNIVEKIISIQSNRIVQLSEIDDEDLITIIEDDITQLFKT